MTFLQHLKCTALKQLKTQEPWKNTNIFAFETQKNWPDFPANVNKFKPFLLIF